MTSKIEWTEKTWPVHNDAHIQWVIVSDERYRQTLHWASRWASKILGEGGRTNNDQQD